MTKRPIRRFRTPEERLIFVHAREEMKCLEAGSKGWKRKTWVLPYRARAARMCIHSRIYAVVCASLARENRRWVGCLVEWILDIGYQTSHSVHGRHEACFAHKGRLNNRRRFVRVRADWAPKGNRNERRRWDVVR
jgi:hypothetical protein